MENSDDKYLYKVFERPETLGEQNQAERLKRFSRDPNDILKTREKLEKLKEDLQEKYENQENTIRRYNRGKLFVITPPSFLEQIFLYSKVKEKFKQKYGKRRKIKSSFFNLLLRQSLFFPGDEVIKYLEREGMQIIGFLKPVMKILYEAGWLDVKGKTILSPEEFNLIHRAKNIVEDENIEDFLKKKDDPNHGEKYALSIKYTLDTFSDIKASQREGVGTVTVPPVQRKIVKTLPQTQTQQTYEANPLLEELRQIRERRKQAEKELEEIRKLLQE
jgi:chaperonin cofactor prefoldin